MRETNRQTMKGRSVMRRFRNSRAKIIAASALLSASAISLVATIGTSHAAETVKFTVHSDKAGRVIAIMDGCDLEADPRRDKGVAETDCALKDRNNVSLKFKAYSDTWDNIWDEATFTEPGLSDTHMCYRLFPKETEDHMTTTMVQRQNCDNSQPIGDAKPTSERRS